MPASLYQRQPNSDRRAVTPFQPAIVGLLNLQQGSTRMYVQRHFQFVQLREHRLAALVVQECRARSPNQQGSL